MSASDGVHAASAPLHAAKRLDAHGRRAGDRSGAGSRVVSWSSNVDDLADALRARLCAALAAGLPLRLALLFGSRATGRAHPGSDFDVGILPASPDLTLHDELVLAAELSAAVSAEVDVVRLDHASPLLEAEAARDGVCLLEAAPGLFRAYRASAISRWIDFEETIAPHRARFLRRLAEGGR